MIFVSKPQAQERTRLVLEVFRPVKEHVTHSVVMSLVDTKANLANQHLVQVIAPVQEESVLIALGAIAQSIVPVLTLQQGLPAAADELVWSSMPAVRTLTVCVKEVVGVIQHRNQLQHQVNVCLQVVHVASVAMVLVHVVEVSSVKTVSLASFAVKIQAQRTFVQAAALVVALVAG